MPEYLRALTVVLILFVITYASTSAGIAELVGKTRAKTWAMVWVLVSASLFITQNFWLFLSLSGLLLLMSAQWERDKLVLYTIVLCIVPPVVMVIPGFGLVNWLTNVTPQDFFGFILLIPLLLHRQNTRRHQIYGRWPLIILCAYFLLSAILNLRYRSVTDATRVMLSSFMATLLPFLAFSFRLDSTERMKNITAAYVFSMLPLATIGIFEVVKSWHLYTSAILTWSTSGLGSHYAERDGILRASGTGISPITFGFMFMVGIGLSLGLSKHSLVTKWRVALIAVLAFGLVSSLSRGPWVGTATIIFLFILMGRNSFKNLLKMVLAATVTIALAIVLPGGQRLLNMLPFVEAATAADTVDYRFKLARNAWAVIIRHPLLGSVDYIRTPEMQEMIQGQGIIDIVNSYLKVGLESGFIGLTLFVLFFVSALFGLARAIKALPDTDVEIKTMGRALFATLVGALVTISTVSLVEQIPYLCWMLTGLCVAHTKLIRSHLSASLALRNEVQRPTKPTVAKLTGARIPRSSPKQFPLSSKIRHE